MLYVPADRPNLGGILAGDRPLGVCCLAICLEDAVRPAERPSAAAALCHALRNAPSLPRPIFVRPANLEALGWLLEQNGIERVSGFILPKATVASIHLWVERSSGLFRLLPIMESREAIDPLGRRDLAHACAAHRPVIPAARIGANDLFSLLGGLRRPRGRTVYETPVGSVIDGLIEAFCAQDIRLCGPVFDHLEDTETLIREVEQDVIRGLFAKTAITPKQAGQIWKSYRPTDEETIEARRILRRDAPAVFSIHGRMMEPACHSEWAKRLLERRRIHFHEDHLSLMSDQFIED
jgi:citrate lyase beta subunit